MRPLLSALDATFLRWVVENQDDVYMTSEQIQQADRMTALGLLCENPIVVSCICQSDCPDSVIVFVCCHTDQARISLMLYDIWAKEKGIS